MNCCKASEVLGLPLCIDVSSIVLNLDVQKAAFPNRLHVQSAILTYCVVQAPSKGRVQGNIVEGRSALSPLKELEQHNKL